MQTFLPYKDFNKSAQALDNKRLNKQILEAYQILKVIGNPDPKAAWRNHPAVKMWRGSEHVLFDYAMCMVREARKRGIRTEKNKTNLVNLFMADSAAWGFEYPEWWNDNDAIDRVLTTHKANLFIKDSGYYYDFESAVHDEHNDPCCERCNYYWPTHLAA